MSARKNSIVDKKQSREQLNKDIEAFLNAGGEIEKIENAQARPATNPSPVQSMSAIFRSS